MFEKITEKINGYYVELLKHSRRLVLNEENLKKIPRRTGVYVFYHRGRRGTPIYVGQTWNLRTRILQNHLSKRSTVSNSSFRSHLRTEGRIKGLGQARKWIMGHCQLKYVLVGDRDDARLLEAILIRMWRGKYHLLNYKGQDEENPEK